MKLTLLAVGTKPPRWIAEGFESYRKRLPRHLALQLIEVPGGPTGRNQSAREVRALEAKALQARMPPKTETVALEIQGKPWSTEDLAEHMRQWQMQGTGITFMIGGADGLDTELLRQARHKWSLGPLTLPHALVRVVVAEQLYRAWTIINNHPYHRA